MKKSLLMMFVMATMLPVGAQQKRLSHLIVEHGSTTYDRAVYYDGSGRVTQITTTDQNGALVYDTQVIYNGNQVRMEQTHYYNGTAAHNPDVVTYTLTDNRITHTLEIGDGEDFDEYTEDYYYTDGRISKIETTDVYQGTAYSVTYDITWTDGNLSEITTYRSSGELNTHTTLHSTSLTADPFSSCLFGLDRDDESAIVFYKNFGTQPRNLPSDHETVFYNEGSYSLVCTYSYEINSDGYVTKAILDNTDEGKHVYTLVWEDNPAAVTAIQADGPDTTTVYDLSGRRQASVRPGLNIVRAADGTTRKVISSCWSASARSMPR